MLIKDVKLYVRPGAPAGRSASSRLGTIEKTPPGVSNIYTHSLGFRRQQPSELVEYKDDTKKPTYSLLLRLATDKGMSAFTMYGSGFHPDDLEWQAKSFKATIAPMLLGVDAFDREYIWQRLWVAQRFFYTGRGVVDTVDNMLWNLAARHARMPIYKLLGGYRDKIPAYRNIGGASIDELVADAVKAKQQGFKGCKDHAYRGPKEYLELARELRAAVGDDFELMHDAVWSYDFDDAVRVGRALERYNYSWIEEPLMDYDLMGAKKLCAALDLPVMAMEWVGAIGGQPYSASAYLALEATDIVRQRAVGITGQIKLAQLAESFGRSVHGGDPHVILAIKNDPIYEAGGWSTRPNPSEVTFTGTTVVENGYMYMAVSDREPEEPNWDEIAKQAVAII